MVKLIGRYPGGMIGRLVQPTLPWIDLVMMRRQLTRLRDLVEQHARNLAGSAALPS